MSPPWFKIPMQALAALVLTLSSCGRDFSRYENPKNMDITTVDGGSGSEPPPPPMPPHAPILLATDPVSPSSQSVPRVLGRSSAGLQIQLYTTSTCDDGSESGNLSIAAEDGTFEIETSDFRKNQLEPIIFHAKAFVSTSTLSSGCSTSSVAYFHDNIAPSAPTFLSGVPTRFDFHLSSEPRPVVLGNAENNTIIRIYLTPNCGGSPLAESSAQDFRAGLLRVPNDLFLEQRTEIRGTATDPIGNTSECSASVFRYAYSRRCRALVVPGDVQPRIFCVVRGDVIGDPWGHKRCEQIGLGCLGVPVSGTPGGVISGNARCNNKDIDCNVSPPIGEIAPWLSCEQAIALQGFEDPFFLCNTFNPTAGRSCSPDGFGGVFRCTGFEPETACPQEDVNTCRICPSCTSAISCSDGGGGTPRFGEWYVECG